jgi:hypothetical protein
VIFLSASLALAQYGTAPSGYYPPNYAGSTFTGVVVDATDDQITMTQDHKGKVESFTGRVETNCSIPKGDGSPQQIGSTVPSFDAIDGFFRTVSKDIGGQKEKYNQLIGLTFNEYEGKPIRLEKRHLYICK